MKNLRIENWSMGVGVTSAYSAPELQRYCLYGNVYNHPNFKDGEIIKTSYIVGITENDEIMTASGSVYELGSVDEEYEEAYPNARFRLINSIKATKEN